MTRIAIHGFGRIGRATLRAALHDTSFTPVAVSDVKDLATLAALFAVDTNYGCWPEEVQADETAFRIGDRAIPYDNVAAGLPDWGALGVDLVIECNGRATTRAGAQPHLDRGAKHVLISAPSKTLEDTDAVLLPGINLEQFDPQRHKIISMGSCTTNALAPVVKIIREHWGIRFIILGSPKLSPRRRAQQRTMDAVLRKAVADAGQMPELRALCDPPIPPRYEPFVRLNANLGGLPAFAGNRVELLPDYAGAVASIVQAIERAQRYVHVEYFEFADDETGGPVIDALIRAQQRGLVCRVLIDHVGNFSFNRQVVKRLRAGGVAVHLMLPVRVFDNEWSRLDLRNHRKIVVVDGEVGFTGSQNLIDRDYHKRSNRKKGLYYIELVARVTGPVVQQLNAAFVTDWYTETGVLLDSTTAPEMLVRVAPTEEDRAAEAPK